MIKGMYVLYVSIAITGYCKSKTLYSYIEDTYISNIDELEVIGTETSYLQKLEVK